MRDAISLRELCAGANRRIDEELVYMTVGSGNRESAYKIINAICGEDYSAVYEVISDIVRKSGDISVFWQELIDSYRDIMVVKNSDKAKSYLDLTDVEYLMLSGFAKTFTMSRLSYHVGILEDAMENMQRAFNSKRSIAEIALTRMCNPKLDGSVDSLLLRIEELERELSMIKLGVITPPKTVEASVSAAPAPTVSLKAAETAEAPKGDHISESPAPFSEWGRALSKIGEIKRPLSAGLANASCERIGKNRFVIKASAFFAKKISGNETDFSIVRGVIAELCGIAKEEISLEITSAAVSGSSSNELDKIFG